jgi:hypothetical protein
MYRYLVLLTISSTLGLEAWLTLFNNFAVEAVGLEGNHIAAVVLPAIGGVLWMIDYRIPFFGGAVFSFVSLMAVQKIQTQRPIV